MNEAEGLPERLQDLIDDYLLGLLDEPGVAELEGMLRQSAAARRHFVLYARVHTDLHLEARARQAGARILEQLDPPAPADQQARSRTFPFPLRWIGLVLVAAACLLVAVGAGWSLWMSRPDATDPVIAWLVNAQDCQWQEGADAVGRLVPGKVLGIERGLAELRFRSGVRVILQGPARIELLSDNSARLLLGKLAARVPRGAAGFEIQSPSGKVIDRGTEFGVSVNPAGVTEVHVFAGEVEARPAEGLPVSLKRDQSARIDPARVTLDPPGASGNFVRAIFPARGTPVSRRLTFRKEAGGLLDNTGAGTGLTHRLPGTGVSLPPHDPNLWLDPRMGRLELTTTDSDLNQQVGMAHGEYLGLRLAELGFTGREDFAVTATFLNIPALEFIGQFGLYAGARSDCCIRGGLISRRQTGQYRQFLVNTHHCRDRDLHMIGLLSTGTDLRLTLTRTGGRYALTVENLTDLTSNTMTVRHPIFLDGKADLYVGLFGANTRSPNPQTLTIQEFEATVWSLTGAGPVGP